MNVYRSASLDCRESPRIISKNGCFFVKSTNKLTELCQFFFPAKKQSIIAFSMSSSQLQLCYIISSLRVRGRGVYIRRFMAALTQNCRKPELCVEFRDNIFISYEKVNILLSTNSPQPTHAEPRDFRPGDHYIYPLYLAPRRAERESCKQNIRLSAGSMRYLSAETCLTGSCGRRE